MRLSILCLILLPCISLAQFSKRLDSNVYPFFTWEVSKDLWVVASKNVREGLCIVGWLEFPNDRQVNCYFSDGTRMAEEAYERNSGDMAKLQDIFFRAYNHHMGQNVIDFADNVSESSKEGDNIITIVVVDETGNISVGARGEVTWFYGPNRMTPTGYPCAQEEFVTDANGKAKVNKKECPYLDITVWDSKGIYGSITGDMRANQKEYQAIQKFK